MDARLRLCAVSAVLAALLAANPAWAQGAQSFPDVPGNHWAAKAVDDVTVAHRLLPVKDGKFNGEALLNRLDFSRTMANFILELEVQSGVSLADTSFSFYNFVDLEEADRPGVEQLANQYNLFDGIPGIEATRLQPKRPVTRYEFAAVMDKMLKLIEKKRLIRSPLVRSPANPFTDVKRLDWAYDSVMNTVVRYRVMTGYPDATFKGDQELTRYQFAAAAAQAFSLIREQASGVVRVRLPRGALQGSRTGRYHGSDPLMVSLDGYATIFPISGAKGAPISDVFARQKDGGRLPGGGHVSIHSVDYPVVSETKMSMVNRLEVKGVDVYFNLNQPEVSTRAFLDASESEVVEPLPAKAQVAAEDINVLAALTYRSWFDAPNTDPYHVQLYGEGSFLLDGGFGSASQAGGGLGLGLGFLSYYRAPALSLSLDIGGGIAGLGIYRFGGPMPPNQNRFFPAARPYGRVTVELQFFSDANSAISPRVFALILPGSLHKVTQIEAFTDDDGKATTKLKVDPDGRPILPIDPFPRTGLITLAVGAGIGYSWR